MYLHVTALLRRKLAMSLLVPFFCASCASESQQVSSAICEQKYLSTLPAELTSSPVQFTQLLNAYEDLNDKQKAAALEYFLGQKNLEDNERTQASYMLARVYQQNVENNKEQADKQIIKRELNTALILFDEAKKNAPLKTNALWHLTEVAILNGKEKLARQAFEEMLVETNDKNAVAAINYGLAQSYLRANEVNKALDTFNKIRVDFPKTNYALGSTYYLATLAYAQLVQGKQPNPVGAATLIKKIKDYYLEYLGESPSGRFSKDVLAKLKSLENKQQLSLDKKEMPVVANAYFAGGFYEQAISYWQKAQPDQFNFKMAECSIKLGHMQLAQGYLFKGLEKYPREEQYLAIAEQISNKLDKADAYKFWCKLHNVRFCRQDAILWQMAIRAPLDHSLNYYQDILYRYPNSSYAPECEWRLIWSKVRSVRDKTRCSGAQAADKARGSRSGSVDKRVEARDEAEAAHTKDRSLQSLEKMCFTAANKYNHSKLAPRFLFWAGKISEMLANKKQAAFYYEKTAALYANDYYGQRAKARLAVIERAQRDDYFELQKPLRVADQSGNWPYPDKAIRDLQYKKQDTLCRLIYLKQYNEVLVENTDLCPELKSWLLGKTKQNLLAINTAVKYMQDENILQKTINKPTETVLWQYAYPLLYKQQIAFSANFAGLSDPLMMNALIREESRYEDNAISQSKALGLCQLMPGTAAGIAKKLGISMRSNNLLFHPDLNIKLGTVYLSSLIRTFHNNALLAVASYNAGGSAVKSTVADNENFVIKDPDYFVEDFPYRETRDYVRKVFSSYWNYRLIYDRQ